MEPLRGGRLTDNIPPTVQQFWDSAAVKRSAAEWGLKWVWNQPEVSMALSGMSAMEQLEENLIIAETALPDSLSSEEKQLIDRVADMYRRLLAVNCTSCGYCMPCPNSVNIPMNFTLYNDACMFEDLAMPKVMYTRMMPPDHRASNCQQCGECEPKCPQQIEIIAMLEKVAEKLG
jgi:predicted aldo/keto reductase-like oxidoreductase